VLAEVSCAITHREPSRVLVSGTEGSLEAMGTLGARGTGELHFRTPRGQAEPIPFEPVDPYAAQLEAFAQRVAQIDACAEHTVGGGSRGSAERGGTGRSPCDAALWNLAILDSTRGSPLPKEIT
jgi:predicted dehydrogenase